MRIAYFDCFSGASGDMILGALVDAGLSPRKLGETLRGLRIPTVRLRVRKVLKGGIAATQVVVEGTQKERPHRHLAEMLRIIDRSRVEEAVKSRSREIFERIASVEGGIHRLSKEEIHFHELGGLDSIVDICLAVWGCREMGFEQIHVSKVNVGTGFVRCEHGILPVPAPAALALMKGKPIYSSGVDRELLTPTGAGILTVLASEFGPMPPMTVEKIGYGAGRSELPHPNLLRLIVGRKASPSGSEKVVVVETNIDDMNPQLYDHVIEGLLKTGVKDVFLTPVLMKKNRPATLLSVVCSPEMLPQVTTYLLQETTTLGLRWREEERARADREVLSLQTRHGRIRFKLARWQGRMVNLSPEYEDCRAIAQKKHLPLKDVFEEARRRALSVLERKTSSSSRRKR